MTPKQRAIIAAVRELELTSPTNTITPRALWESARDKSHPLHHEFEWDDSVAADAYRDEQARRLLRLRVTITHNDRVIDAPICVRSPDAPPSEAGYVRITSVVDDREKARRALLDEIARAARAVERARVVAEALGLGDDCERLLSQLARLREAAA